MPRSEVDFGWMILVWLRNRRARIDAERRAMEHVRTLRPGELLRGSFCAANEPDRFVVLVYCGTRAMPIAQLLPPWKECLIVAIPKDGDRPTLLDDPRYRPILR